MPLARQESAPFPSSQRGRQTFSDPHLSPVLDRGVPLPCSSHPLFLLRYIFKNLLIYFKNVLILNLIL